jgi:hypothetical protein
MRAVVLVLPLVIPLVSACVDRAADRAALDTLPPQALSGRGETVAAAKCVYDRVLGTDCKSEFQRLLITRDAATGDVVVMCDDHPGYGRSTGSYAGYGLAGAIAQIAAVNEQSRLEHDSNRYPVFSLVLRPGKTEGALDATAWALNDPEKGPGRRQMMVDAFGACTK